MYLLTAGEMQAMDRATIEDFGVPGRVLMENAGRGAVEVFLETFGDLARQHVGVVAGRGNNGGDGFVMARYLHQLGIRVTVYLLADPQQVTGDAEANLKLLAPLGVPVISMPEDAEQSAFKAHQSAMRHHPLWVDAILGTGLKSDVKGYFRDIITFINGLEKPVFAVDVPSGLNSDTGQVCGVCIKAIATATFAWPKIGHVLYPGAAHTGKLSVIDIGIPGHITQNPAPRQQLLSLDTLCEKWRPRPADAHKGLTGHLLVAAGATGKTGAAALTAMAALRAGAGLVTLGIPASLNPILETQVLEAMTEPLPEIGGKGGLGAKAFDRIMTLLEGKKGLALGPGLGTADATRTLVQRLIQHSGVPIVVDADGLNCLAGNTQILTQSAAPVILTPHPGEMARLTGCSTQEVQQDRMACAREFATAHNVYVVLKGAATLIATPEGKVWVNPTGNAGMATGGMGDVLTGVIAGLLVQGYAPETAACMGAFSHGAAADELARRQGPCGFLASDVMAQIPRQINQLAQRAKQTHAPTPWAFPKVNLAVETLQDGI